MRIRLLFPGVMSAALALFGFSVGGVQAGSFFGPSCYGADYGYQYPNRAQNQIGCGPGNHCQARHPLFRRLFHRHQNATNQGMPQDGMAGYAMPMNMVPANGVPGNVMPIPNMEAPVVQSPSVTAPVHTTSIAPAPVPVMPAVQSRIAPVPAPLPPGPVGSEPASVDPSGKPPF